MNEIRSCAPVFAAADPAALAAYYVAVLGFTAVGEAGPEYAVVALGGHEIHFHLAQVPAMEAEGYRGGAYFVVEDPDVLHAALAARGARVHYAPEDRPYGMRDFSVLDPEGHSLCFGRPAGKL